MCHLVPGGDSADFGACLCSRIGGWIWRVSHVSVGYGCEWQVGAKPQNHFKRFGGRFSSQRVLSARGPFMFSPASQGFAKPVSSVRGDNHRDLGGHLILKTFLSGPKKSHTGDTDPECPPDLSCWVEVSWGLLCCHLMCPPSSELQGGQPLCSDGTWHRKTCR